MELGNFCTIDGFHKGAKNGGSFLMTCATITQDLHGDSLNLG